MHLLLWEDQRHGQLERRVTRVFHDLLDHLGGRVELGLGHLEQKLVVDLAIPGTTTPRRSPTGSRPWLPTRG